MFRDLKEYQQLRALYEEQVYSTDLQKIIEEVFEEENFSDEELEYVYENIDVLINDNFLTEEIEELHQPLNEYLGVVASKVAQKAGKQFIKGGVKNFGKTASTTASRMAGGFAKNINKIPAASRIGGGGAAALSKIKSVASGAVDKFKNVASKLKDKAGKAISKGVDFAKKNKPAVGGGAALGAVVAGGLIKRGLDKRAAEKAKTTTTLTDKDKDDIRKEKETANIKINPADEKSSTTTTTTTTTKPKKMGEIERQNRQRLGDKRVNFLKQKQRDFKSMDRAEFRKKYPNSQSAKDAAARKRRPNIMDYSSYTPEGDTINERLGGKGVSKKAAAGSIYPGEKGDGQTEDQDRGAGNKAKKRAGETVEKKSPTFMAYIKNKKEDKKESFDAYDIVLEYLLSSQQVATIEEANYIMTEMDAKTIQDIVSQQLNEQN